MREYDAALKRVLQPGSLVLAALAPSPVEELLTVELPAMRTLRADLLGRLANGDLLHVEMQSANDPRMALRMSEYANAIYREFGQSPWQGVLYVGDEPLRMERQVVGRHGSFPCPFVDIRDVDGEPLLASARLGGQRYGHPHAARGATRRGAENSLTNRSRRVGDASSGVSAHAAATRRSRASRRRSANHRRTFPAVVPPVSRPTN